MSTDSLPATIEKMPMPTVQQGLSPPKRQVPAHSLQDVWEMAEAAAASRMFPGVQTPQAAFTLMLLCQSEGLHPMQALKRYHIIEGRPSLRADAMQAEFQRRGGRIAWIRYDDKEARAVFSHPDYQPDGIELSVTFEEFHKSGLTTGEKGIKKNWRQSPGPMLRARLVSQGIRMVAPDIVAGIYTPEEVSDFEPSNDYAPPPAVEDRRPAPDNGSGYGRTNQYASPEQVREYTDKLNGWIDKKNAEWFDWWTGQFSGEIPKDLPELLNPWQANGHLLKWCVEAQLLDPTIVPEDAKVRQAAPYIAVVYHRSKEDRKALGREMEEYAQKQARIKTEAFYRKHPEMRPAEEQGDAGPEPGDEMLDEIETTEAGARG